MAVANAKEIFNSLYRDINGFKLSHAARAKKSSWYFGLIYGEVTYDGFIRMLAKVKPRKDEVFYDLGSGTGKAVVLAALLGNFSKVAGVEILRELHDASREVLGKYSALTKDKNESDTKMEFIHGDFGNTDFSDADIIFINATCFGYEIDLPFMRKLEGLKKGSRIITSTLFINSPHYKITEIIPVPFTWGEEKVYIQERL